MILVFLRVARMWSLCSVGSGFAQGLQRCNVLETGKWRSKDSRGMGYISVRHSSYIFEGLEVDERSMGDTGARDGQWTGEGRAKIEGGLCDGQVGDVLWVWEGCPMPSVETWERCEETRGMIGNARMEKRSSLNYWMPAQSLHRNSTDTYTKPVEYFYKNGMNITVRMGIAWLLSKLYRASLIFATCYRRRNVTFSTR